MLKAILWLMVTVEVASGVTAWGQAVPATTPTASSAGTASGEADEPLDPRLRVFADYAPAGAYLVGMETGFRRAPAGNLYYSYLLPLYSTGAGDLIEGKAFGRANKQQQVHRLVAKDGYAVVAILCRYPFGTMLGGHRLVYDKVDGDRMRLDDSYPSKWVGDRGADVLVDTKGEFVIGVRLEVASTVHGVTFLTASGRVKPVDFDRTVEERAPAGLPAYAEPDPKRAPFAGALEKLGGEQRVAIARAIGKYVAASEPNAVTPKLMGVGLAMDPDDRALVLANASLKRGTFRATSRPAQEGKDEAASDAAAPPVKELLTAAGRAKGGGGKEELALAACLYDLALALEPGQEEALYQLEVMRNGGVAADWAWAIAGPAAPAADLRPVVTTSAGARDFARQQTTVKGISVVTDGNGQRLGRVLEVILTVSPAGKGKVVDFVSGKVGGDMRTALDEAVRTVRIRYPEWEREKRVLLSFDDKYSPKDGGSAGTAFALGLLSALEGWEVDPRFAVTGDITVDGKVRPVGGVDAKVRGAVADGIALVAVPAGNAERMADYLVLHSAKALAEVQVFAVATLSEAGDLARVDRPEELARAVELFREFQDQYRAAPGKTLAAAGTKDRLREVLELAPNHLSAKYLLMSAEGRQPKKLSVGMTMYRMAVATNRFAAALKDARKFTNERLPDTVFTEARAQLRGLRAMAAEEAVPALTTLTDFVDALHRYNMKVASQAEVDRRFDAWRAAMSRLSADADTMAKVLREGV